MSNRIYISSLLLITSLFTLSCEEKYDPALDAENFTKIYDNSVFSGTYSPIDVIQTEDEGYVVLASTAPTDTTGYSGIYLMKVSKNGEFEKEIRVDGNSPNPQSVNPVGELVALNGKYYFFCMDAETTDTKLATFDQNLDSVNMVALSTGLSYPAASAADGQNFVLLSYDHANLQTVISLVDVSGNVVSGPTGFDIGIGDEYLDKAIMDHFTHSGKQFPFFVGRIPNGQYYFNGFVNYSLSLVFTDLSNSSGSYSGQLDDGGLSALLPLSGTTFAASRFNFGDNYLLPNVSLSTSGNPSSTDLGGNTLPELIPNAKVRITQITDGTKNTVIFGSDTRSRQIGLYFYDASTGDFSSSRYLGFSNPFEMADCIQTKDGGLVVCGLTYLVGRFPRICLFKLSADELAENM